MSNEIFLVIPKSVIDTVHAIADAAPTGYGRKIQELLEKNNRVYKEPDAEVIEQPKPEE